MADDLENAIHQSDQAISGLRTINRVSHITWYEKWEGVSGRGPLSPPDCQALPFPRDLSTTSVAGVCPETGLNRLRITPMKSLVRHNGVQLRLRAVSRDAPLSTTD